MSLNQHHTKFIPVPANVPYPYQRQVVHALPVHSGINPVSSAHDGRQFVNRATSAPVKESHAVTSFVRKERNSAPSKDSESANLSTDGNEVYISNGEFGNIPNESSAAPYEVVDPRPQYTAQELAALGGKYVAAPHIRSISRPRSGSAGAERSSSGQDSGSFEEMFSKRGWSRAQQRAPDAGAPDEIVGWLIDVIEDQQVKDEEYNKEIVRKEKLERKLEKEIAEIGPVAAAFSPIAAELEKEHKENPLEQIFVPIPPENLVLAMIDGDLPSVPITVSRNYLMSSSVSDDFGIAIDDDISSSAVRQPDEADEEFFFFDTDQSGKDGAIQPLQVDSPDPQSRTLHHAATAGQLLTPSTQRAVSPFGSFGITADSPHRALQRAATAATSDLLRLKQTRNQKMEAPTRSIESASIVDTRISSAAASPSAAVRGRRVRQLSFVGHYTESPYLDHITNPMVRDMDVEKFIRERAKLRAKGKANSRKSASFSRDSGKETRAMEGSVEPEARRSGSSANSRSNSRQPSPSNARKSPTGSGDDNVLSLQRRRQRGQLPVLNLQPPTRKSSTNTPLGSPFARTPQTTSPTLHKQLDGAARSGQYSPTGRVQRKLSMNDQVLLTSVHSAFNKDKPNSDIMNQTDDHEYTYFPNVRYHRVRKDPDEMSLGTVAKHIFRGGVTSARMKKNKKQHDRSITASHEEVVSSINAMTSRIIQPGVLAMVPDESKTPSGRTRRSSVHRQARGMHSIDAILSGNKSLDSLVSARRGSAVYSPDNMQQFNLSGTREEHDSEIINEKLVSTLTDLHKDPLYKILTDETEQSYDFNMVMRRHNKSLREGGNDQTRFDDQNVGISQSGAESHLAETKRDFRERHVTISNAAVDGSGIVLNNQSLCITEPHLLRPVLKPSAERKDDEQDIVDAAGDCEYTNQEGYHQMPAKVKTKKSKDLWAIYNPRTKTLNITIHASDLKVLSSFHSLPPPVWVTCRIVYFLIISFYQLIICEEQNYLYRSRLNCEKIWKIIKHQVEVDGITIDNVSSEYSWPFFQVLLMKFPVIFTKLLEVIEHGLPAAVESHNHRYGELGDNQGADVMVTTANSVHSAGSNIGSGGFPAEVFFDTFNTKRIALLRELIQHSQGLFNVSHLITSAPVAAQLCCWAKRVIALIYSRHLERRRSSSVQNIPAGESETNSRMGTPYHDGDYRNGTEKLISGARMDTAPSQSEEDVLQPSILQYQHQLMPNLSFAVAVDDAFQAVQINGPIIGRNPQQYSCNGNDSVQAGNGAIQLEIISSTITHSLSLVKPSDRLDLMLTTPSPESHPHWYYPYGQIDPHLEQEIYAEVQSKYEAFLQDFASSPLHRIVMLSPYSQEQIKLLIYQEQRRQMMALKPRSNSLESLSNDTRDIAADEDSGSYKLEMAPVTIPDMLHPFITHCMQANASVSDEAGQSGTGANIDDSISRAGAISTADILIVHLDRARPPVLLPSSEEIIQNSLRNFPNDEPSSSLDLRFSLVLVDEVAAQQMRPMTPAQSNCSISQLQTAAEADSLQVAVAETLGPNKFLVFVADSESSWVAFQLACKLAKPSDEIVAVHVPSMFSHDFKPDLSNDLSALKTAPHYLSYPEYEQRRAACTRRAEALAERYRSAGYNLYIDMIPDFLECAQRFLVFQQRRIYFESLQDKNNNCGEARHFLENQEMYALALRLLHIVQLFRPTFVVLGGYDSCIQSVLSPPLGPHDRNLNFPFSRQVVDCYADTFNLIPPPAAARTTEERTVSHTPVRASVHYPPEEVAGSKVQLENSSADYDFDEDFDAESPTKSNPRPPPAQSAGDDYENDSFIIEDAACSLDGEEQYDDDQDFAEDTNAALKMQRATKSAPAAVPAAADMSAYQQQHDLNHSNEAQLLFDQYAAYSQERIDLVEMVLHHYHAAATSPASDVPMHRVSFIISNASAQQHILPLQTPP